jgi:hypothetical protein
MEAIPFSENFLNTRLISKDFATVIFFNVYDVIARSQDSAVGIATGYRLDDRGIGV